MTVFFLGSHPALSAAELAAYAERHQLSISWDLSRLPVALLGQGDFPAPRSPALPEELGGVGPAPSEMQRDLGGTTMIGRLHATFSELPSSAEILTALPEILEVRNGKRLVGLSALALNPSGARGSGLPYSSTQRSDLAGRVRHLAMELKRAIGMKGTRIVFPPARNASRSDADGPAQRSDLSTAQLLHNNLPNSGTAIVFLVEPARSASHSDAGGQGRVDLVTVSSIQDIQAYAQRDRGRPHADPGRGMLPPKVAQIMINLSLVPARGTMYDPFCGVGTIPMEAMLCGLQVIASDGSPTQVERTKGNLEWVRKLRGPRSVEKAPEPRVFTHNVSRGAIPLDPRSVDVIVTEGWLGPPRTTSPLPKETEEIFSRVAEILKRLLKSADAVARPGGRVVVSVPAFRVRKRLVRFPLASTRTSGWTRESLVPPQWMEHPLFREAASGTLLYGRPDAVVLREIIRFRKR